ncbi:5'-methylthioadenosine/adenosylhomocysteine nucleosidase [bacterium]|nr:5'-methylthioadenosine/adenosylhomocysteine nucleosidase [bacterium]
MKKFFIFLIFILVVISVCLLSVKEENIAIIGAMDCEVSEIASHLKNPASLNKNQINVTKGKLGKYNVILSKSGIGKVNAAMTTQFIIDKYNPKYIINTGLAGALADNLHSGDIIIAENVIQHDTKDALLQYSKWKTSQEFDREKPYPYSSDRNLAEFYKNKLTENGNRVHLGTIATGDIFVEDRAKKDELNQNFGAAAVDMESGAIMQVGDRNSTPVLVIRTICDSLTETEEEYSGKEEEFAKKSASSLISVIENE